MTNDKLKPYHLQKIQATEEGTAKKERVVENKMFKMLKGLSLPNPPKRKSRGGLSMPNPFTIENLREHLRVAMTLELSTIPPYLCALYSIETGDKMQPNNQEEFGDNLEVTYIIRSVMMEEMLHFSLVGNILNAVGGEVKINHKEYVPEYPTVMPHSDGAFEISLQKFSKSALQTFLRIEEPTPAGTLPKIDNYETIGQFYQGIILLMEALECPECKRGLKGSDQCLKNCMDNKDKKTIFTGDPALQVDEKYYYGAGDESIIPVTDLASAKKAIEIIMEQGEGTEHSIYEDNKEVTDEIRDLAHYFKFKEIYEEQRYAECQLNPREQPQGTKMAVKYDKVHNMMMNPKTEDFVSDELKQLSHEFNAMYRQLLDNLQAAFTGEQDQLIPAVRDMYKLKYKAVELMRNPIPGARVNAGPTFEYVESAAKIIA